MLKKTECCNNLGCAEESGGGCPKYRKEIFCVLNSLHQVTEQKSWEMGITVLAVEQTNWENSIIML